jgi:hypothetical protein
MTDTNPPADPLLGDDAPFILDTHHFGRFAEGPSFEHVGEAAPADRAAEKCACFWTDPSTWTTHYGAAEPGSQREWNPECPEHGHATEIRARLKAATPGPWTTGSRDDSGNLYIGQAEPGGALVATAGDGDAELIAHAPMDLAYLLARVEELEGQLAKKQRDLNLTVNQMHQAKASALRELQADERAEDLQRQLDSLLPIASPRRETQEQRERNWRAGAWESFARRASGAQAAANRWTREAERLEGMAASRRREVESGQWPYKEPTTAPDSEMDPFEAADDMDRRWE